MTVILVMIRLEMSVCLELMDCIPHTSISVWALLMDACQDLVNHLVTIYSRLSPNGALLGLRQDYKMYLLAYL